MKKYSYFLLPLILVISGCGTLPNEQFSAECQRTTPSASRARWDCLRNASAKTDEFNKQQYVQSIVRRCQSFGFTNGTPGFNQCLFQQNQIEIQNNAAAEALRIQQEQVRLQQIQQGLQMLSPTRPLTCTKLPGSYTSTCQ